MEQLNLSTAAGRIKLDNHFGDVLSSFQVNMYPPMTQQFRSQVFHSREMNYVNLEKKSVRIFRLSLLIIKAKNWKQPNFPPTTEQIIQQWCICMK